MIEVQRHFEKTTGLKFVWENEPREILQKPYGVLKLGASSMIGRDDIYEDQLVGSREMILQVQVFSRSFRITENARVYLEKARTSIDHERRSIAFEASQFRPVQPVAEANPYWTRQFRFRGRAS